MTPPGGDVAALISACNDECLDTLKASGWRKATTADADRLKAQIETHGERLRETDGS